MPAVREPTRDELRRYAASAHLSPSEAELDELAEEVGDMLEAVERVERYPEPPAPLRSADGPRESRRASEGEDPHNAWITRCRVAGAADGALAGRTVGLKDSIALAGVEMTCGSEVLAGYVPGHDATVVSRLLDAGATIVGKLNMDAFSFSSSGATSDFGPVTVPGHPDRLAGGSSGGAAAAVAAGQCDLAIGGDQGGSIRLPSAWCGVVGLKPTRGLVPYTGIFPVDISLDHIGPLAATVADVARCLDVIAGPDRSDGVALDPRQPRGLETGRYEAALDRGIAGLRVGRLAEGLGWEFSDPEVDACFERALDALREAGAEVCDVSVPAHRRSVDLWTVIAGQGGIDLLGLEGVGIHFDGWYNTELLSVFAERRRTRADRYPPTVKATWLLASYLRDHFGGRHYARAQNMGLAMRAAYNHVLEDVDVMAMPTTPMLAPPRPAPEEPSPPPVAPHNLANTAPFDLTAHPALSVPAPRPAGALPVGVMLVGRHFDEATLLRAGRALESAAAG